VIARSQLIPQKIYYANVAVWIIHTQSQRVLLELRSKYKKRNPHKWCLVGGHVSVDQTYTAAALNEVKEEVNINIPLEQLRYLCVSYPCKNSRSFTFHYYYFIPQIPAKIKYQKSEVEKIQ
jgi:8-oxo-dGTP pyrophosphatase MutT (NUDIX family)